MLTLGAGCDEGALETNDTDVQVDMTTSTVDGQKPVTEDFTATATASGPGTLLVKWQHPEVVEPGTTYRVLHSANPEPVVPGAYWYERSSPEAVEAEVPGVPSGHRYVRVCEYRNKECVKYTNTVEVDVQ